MSPVWLFRSLASRIAISAAVLGISVIAVVSVLGFVALNHQLKLRATDELDAKRGLLRHILLEIPTASSLPTQQHRLNDVLVGHGDLHLVLFDSTGTSMVTSFSPLAGTVTPLVLQQLSALSIDTDNWVSDWTAPSGERMFVSTGTAEFANGEKTRFALLQDRRADDTLLSSYAKALVIGLPIALLVTIVGAWFIAKSGLLPLQRFAHLAGSVSSQSLAGRIHVRSLPTELQELATSFNAMLARIDEGVTRLTQFSGDLAHEMRTPVSIVLGRTQVALSKPRDAKSLRDALANNVEELERMARLIADMLFLAQADQDKASLQREALHLDFEARLVVDFLTDVAAERELRIDVTGAAQIQGNRILVRRAISNLLTNAIRHATVATMINVNIGEERDGVTLDVVNEGTPIATNHLDKLFERFYRADADRGRGSGGTGLGLAIVRSIMRMHHGEITVSSHAGGLTTFRLCFPRASQAN